MSTFLTALWVEPYPTTRAPDGRNWRLLQDFIYMSEILGKIIVPIGFLTDFASTPAAVWARIPPWGKYGPATVIHDWLYWMQPCTREQADNVLREGMIVLGVDKQIIDIIYGGVRLGGRHGWDNDAADRIAGREHVS